MKLKFKFFHKDRSVFILQLLMLSFTICFENSFAQKQTNFWYFGTLAGLDFTSGSPVVLTNGPINVNEGTASISDASGNLLFFTDGVTVWDNTIIQMPNGFGLKGDASTTQTMIVPNPGNSNKYYVFTLDDEGGGDGLNYSVVDMTLNSGKGDVTVKNSSLKNSMTEKVAAVYHCNSHDIWVMTHELGTDAFIAYLITDTGIVAPVVSNVGTPQTDVHGEIKFNSLGNQLACAVGYQDFVEIFCFDNATGLVSNPLSLSFAANNHSYGLEFSPDNSKLYATYYELGNMSNLVQYDLNASNIQSSMITIGSGSFDPNYQYGIQLGPDNKIYVTKEVTPFLSVINNPDLLGAACNFVDNAINLDPSSIGTMCMLGLPGFMQSYFNPNFPTVPCIPNVACNTSLTTTTSQTGLCANDSNATATVNPSGGTSPYKYSWSNGDTTQTIIGLSAGTYIVTVTDFTGTIDIDSVVIVAPPLVTIDAGANVTILPGDSVTLNVTGNNVIKYSWSPGTGLSNDTIANPVANPSVTTTYIITGTDANNCTVFDTITVNVRPVKAEFQSSDTTCKGSCIDISDSSSSTTTSWKWTFQGANPVSASVQNPTNICYPDSGIYNITLIASNGTISDTITKTITISPNPGPTLDAGVSSTIQQGDSVMLNATGNNVINYSWSPSIGLSDTSIANPIAKPAINTTYYIIGTDSKNCNTMDSVTIIVEKVCGELFIPTAFSPNEDTQNEMECVMGGCIKTLKFAIFDRWGEKVFETTDPAICWDGKYKGKLLSTATFVYYLEATLNNGDEVTKKGNITLIR